MYSSFDAFGSMGRGTGVFSQHFRCYSANMLPGNERPEVNYGGKIILPPSALAKLASLNIQYPMLFELNHDSKQRTTHAGVLEFIAEEGRVYVPQWMMNTLLLQEGDVIHIKSASIPLGKFVKIQPQSVAFLDITDPKAVLENAFRNFSTLTAGDIITIKYNNKFYDILVMETKPQGKGISIIETDLEVDFAAPLGYKEPQQKSLSKQPSLRGSTNMIEEHIVKEDALFSPFKGSGQKLNGKALKDDMVMSAKDEAGVPAALHLPPGKIFLGYPVKPYKKSEGEENQDPKEPIFKGQGQTLRASKKDT